MNALQKNTVSIHTEIDIRKSAKDWLMRGWRLDREINSLNEARSRAYAQLTGGAISYGEKVQKTKLNNQEELRIAYLAYEDKINRRIAELIKVKTEILTAVEMVNNPTLRTLLIERYINFKTWEQVAESMGYSAEWTEIRLHKMALTKIGEVIPPPDNF